MHRCEHHRMLAHAQVIVGTPDGHPILQAVIKGLRKVTGAPLEVGKDPISIFRSYELEMRLKELIEIHCALCRLSRVHEIEQGEPGQTIKRTEIIAVHYRWTGRRLCPDKTGTACDLFRFGLSEFERQL